MSMPRRGIATVCVLVAALFAVPAAAQAATPNPFFGVVGVHAPDQGELDRVAAAGAGTFRIQVDWRFLEPRPGVRNFAPTDLLFAQAARAGITALPDLLGVPKWLSRDRSRPPIRNARQRAAWTSLLSELAHRYGSTGTFWDAHPELPRRPVTTWEIWHEPNLPVFFGDKPSPRGFAQLLILSSAALKGADPAAQVVSGGIWPYRVERKTLDLIGYLKALYRVPGFSSAVDAVGVHPFAAKPKGVLALVTAARRIMRSHGDGAKPIWVTSFGWVTGGKGLPTPALRTTPREQAAKLTATYGLLAANAASLGIDRALWFSYTDRSNRRAPDFLLGRAGLFRLNGRPKPAWFAFARVAGGNP
jgi:polysaccharide biosynthesis protein PslG